MAELSLKCENNHLPVNWLYIHVVCQLLFDRQEQQKNQLFQVPSITESKIYGCVPKGKEIPDIFSEWELVSASATWVVYHINLEAKV